jgi:hypothetical protein
MIYLVVSNGCAAFLLFLIAFVATSIAHRESPFAGFFVLCYLCQNEFMNRRIEIVSLHPFASLEQLHLEILCHCRQNQDTASGSEFESMSIASMFAIA